MSIASMGRRDYLSPSERSVNTLPRLVGKGANGRKQPLRAIVQPCDLAHLAPQTSRILVQALQVDLEWRTVTEIPEHLLKRSKERRGALAGETGDAAPAAPAASAPAVAKAAPVAAAPAAPPPPKPDPAYVTAAKTRKKIPFWAMATLSLLPLWAFIYLLALQPREQTVEGPLAIGAGVYGSCAGCHGAAGQGGAGRAFANGEVLKTFPKIEDMLNFVYTGSQAYVAKELTVYGNPDREGGAHAPLSYNGNPMPQQGQMLGGALTEAEILGVVCHERYTISGADAASEEWKEEFETWCSPESEIFLALENGATSFATLDKDFASLPKPPAFVGTEARPSAK